MPLSFRSKPKSAFPVIYINTSDSGRGRKGMVSGGVARVLGAGWTAWQGCRPGKAQWEVCWLEKT